MNYTLSEQMVVVAARLLQDGDAVYTGVGLPTVAAFLAKLTHAPNLTIIFETGIIRTDPCLLPQGVDTLPSQTLADKLSDAFYINTLAERGLVNLGFVGAGQLDRHGNINSTCVGDYRQPRFRFPGGGGACDIASLCQNWVAILRQKKIRFPERVDFVTGPGYLDGSPGARERAGLPPGTGPKKVITDLGVFGFVDGELTLETIHARAGVRLETVRENVAWPLRELPSVGETLEPTGNEIDLLRNRIGYRSGSVTESGG
ncbi:MAG: CoA-transferase [Opitutaceae bacterium]|nr:CoA-transferase [Opitutaceae bacterium]